jgi:hypothetical protein
MTHQPNQPDPVDIDVDRTLAALNSAAPPEGMEARVLQTLETQRLAAYIPAQPGAPFMRSRKDAHGWVASHSSWLRGALTGALVATAVCALAFYLTYRHTPPQIAARSSQPPRSTAATPVSMTSNTSAPCDIRVPHSTSAWAGNVAIASGMPHPGSASLRKTATNDGVPHPSLFRDGWDEYTPSAVLAHSPRLIPASFAPSKPAPPAPLTAQERALVQFAANPAALAALTHTATQKSDAEREADFQKFFAPSPELLAAQKAAEQAAHAGNTSPPPADEIQN